MRRTDRTSAQRDPGWTWSSGAFRHQLFLLVDLFLVVLLAMGSISLGQAYGQGLQPDEQPHAIRGTVVNAVTGAPIARALVFSTDNRFARLTDGEGHFEFTLPKTDSSKEIGYSFSGPQRQMWLVPGSGGTWLMARKPGFLDDPDGRPQTEAAPSGEITIPLMPEGLIKGRIIVSESDPALGLNVQLFSRQVQEGMPRWVRAGTARANSTGEFRIAELLPGTYKLATNEWMDNDPVTTVPGGQLYGFPPVYYPGVSDFAAAGTITLATGQTVQLDLPLTRQPYYPVRIPIANTDLNIGMNVTVSVQGHRGPGYSLGYNAEKQRIEGSLPNGNYLVEATTYGQNSVNGAVNISVAGAAAEGPSMTLVHSSSISVHVNEQFTASGWSGSGTSSSGGRSFQLHGPRIYLNVRAEPVDDLEQRGSGSLRPPKGPDDDSLVLENLSPGRYRLQLSSGRGYVAAATMGAVDLLHEPLLVTPGSSVPIEVTLRDDYAEIEGTVTGLRTESAMTGGPFGPEVSPPAVWVYCVPLPDSPGQFQEFGISPDFSSATMMPGTYRVLAFKKPQPHLPYRDPEAMKPYETMGPVVHLSAGQKTNVQVPLILSSE